MDEETKPTGHRVPTLEDLDLNASASEKSEFPPSAEGSEFLNTNEEKTIDDTDLTGFGTFRYSVEGESNEYDSDASFTCGSDDESDEQSDESDEDVDDVDGQSMTQFPWIKTGAIERKFEDIRIWDLNPLLVHSQLPHVTKELIERQLSFLKKLQTLQDFRDVSVGRGLVPEEDLKHALPNLDNVMKCHLMLKDDIGLELGRRPAAPHVGKVFVKYAPFFKLHEKMIHSSDESKATIMRLNNQNDERIQRLLQKYKINRIPLWEFTSEPFKYLVDMKELFSRYIRKIELAAPDRTYAEDSLRSIQNVLDSIDNLKDYYEKCERMKTLRPQFKKFNIEIMAERRRLILETRVEIVNPQNGKTSEVDAFLFNDLLILCKPSLHEAGINSITRLQLRDTFISKGGHKHITIHSPQQVIEIKPQQPHYKTWFKDLQENCVEPSKDVKNMEYDGSRAPRLLSPRKASNCAACKQRLQASAKGKHCHCCGKIICDGCNDWKMVLNYDPRKARRICELCYRRLTLRA